MKEEIKRINDGFTNHFKDLNYKQEKSVGISSKVDKSVVFIGSAISVLKPIFLQEQIDEQGNFIIQRALRTRALNQIREENYLEWSSYFDALGVLTKYENRSELVHDSLSFLKNILAITDDSILARVHKNDTDLIETLEDTNIKIEVDTKPEKYYTHKYGLEQLGIAGRNFNLAIEDKRDGEYKDIGNIIVIESNEKKYGVEFALGTNALIMRSQGLSTSIEASSISDIINITSPRTAKFADCVSVVSHLAYENIMRLSNERSPIYLYKKYLKALKYWQQVLGITNDELENIIKSYILLEYDNYPRERIEDNVLRLYR